MVEYNSRSYGGIEMIEETMKAYIAGIFDGEGSIYIAKNFKPKVTAKVIYSCIVNITNTNEKVMRMIASFYGNTSIECRKRLGENFTIYTWRLQGARLLPFLYDIKPYSIIKKH